MSSFIVDNFLDPWETSGTALWSLGINTAPSDISDDGFMTITSIRGKFGDTTPYARRVFNLPLDLNEVDELCFWFRSSRACDGSSDKPFYIILEALSKLDDTPSWSRLILIKTANKWELHHIWLDDMFLELRKAVGCLQLRSLDLTIAFNAAISSILAVKSEPLQDVEQALLERLNNRFEVKIGNVNKIVPTLIDLPENQGERILPYILITPLSIQRAKKERAGEIIDNYTVGGAFIRPSPEILQLEYIITAFASERPQKAHLFEEILRDFSRKPYLFINGERISFIQFMPSIEETIAFNTPGQTPLFYRLCICMEANKRQFQKLAVPFLNTGPNNSNFEVLRMTSRDFR